VATELIGHVRPFFAPISALLILGLSFGQRSRRAIENAFGVALGIFIADLLVNVIGGGTWQLLVIVPLAMSVAVLLGAPPQVVTQTGVSAVLVVVFEQPEGFSFARSVDVLVGGASALLISFVVLPVDPVVLVRRGAGPVVAELAGTLEDVAAALQASSRDQAVLALRRARELDPLAAAFADALAAGRETALAALPRRRALTEMETFAEAGAQLDLAVRNARVIARGALRGIEVGDHIPPEACVAVRELAEAVRALGPWLEGSGDPAAVRDTAVRAAERANLVLETTANLSVSLIVGSVRAAAVDLIRGTGLSREDALALVRRTSPPS
jgi:uncharacterized membrane protein YccC